MISRYLDEINVEDNLSHLRCIMVLMTLRNLVEIYDWNNFMLRFIIHGDIFRNCLHPWQITSMGFKLSFPKHVEKQCVVLLQKHHSQDQSLHQSPFLQTIIRN